MALYHENSEIATVSDLSLFSVPPTQVAVTKTRVQNYYPVSEYGQSDSPIEFNIPGNGLEYISLKDTKLFLKLKITKTTKDKDKETVSTANTAGTPADKTKKKTEEVVTPPINVGPINLTLQSLWSQIDVYLNEKLVSAGGNNYPYKAYLQTLLNYGADAKTSQLQNQLYYKDTPKYMDANDCLKGGNQGLLVRTKYFAKDKVVDLFGPLHIDFFQCPRYLLNNVSLRLKLYKTSKDFFLMCNGSTSDYKVKIEEAILKVTKVTVSPSITLAHAAALKQTTAKYPIKKVEVKAISIAKGSHGVSLDDIWLGKVPSKVIICFVNSSAMSGNSKLNPYNLQHFGASQIACYLNGESAPAAPIKLKFNKDSHYGSNYMEAYETIFSGTQVMGDDYGSDIGRDDVPAGYFLTVFNFEPVTNLDSQVWNLKQSGNLRIVVDFSIPLEQTVNMIVYGEFPDLIRIDETRNIIMQ